MYSVNLIKKFVETCVENFNCVKYCTLYSATKLIFYFIIPPTRTKLLDQLSGFFRNKNFIFSFLLEIEERKLFL
jgi:hypothetical protein